MIVFEEKTKDSLTNKLPQNRRKIQQQIIKTPATSSKEEHDEQASQIIPGLYLGGYEAYRDISDRKDTKKFSVVIKVNTQNHTKKNDHFYAPVPPGVTHIDIGVADDAQSWENLYKNLCDKNTFDHIDTALQSNTNVLVHCTMGTSRSAAVVIAYLAYRFDVTVEQANNFVISKRRQVKTKFLQNLKEIEEELRERGRKQPQNYPITEQGSENTFETSSPLSDQKITRFHPALPSIPEAKSDYSCVRSDHAPFLVTIPQEAKSESKQKSIKIVSWNVLQEDWVNGFSEQGKYGETPIQREGRHQRIANSLASFAEKNEPHFITLQELAPKDSKDLYDKIHAKLSPRYAAILPEHGECVTFYDTQTYRPIRDLQNNPIDLLGNHILFEHLTDETTVKIGNVHASSQVTHEDHEKLIKDFLDKKEEAPETVSVIVGDFNHNIAPLDNTPKNITTCVSASKHQLDKLQGASSIDGAFYSSVPPDSERRICKQATIAHLDPITGEVYTEDTLKPVDPTSVSAAHARKISNYRMVIAIDENYQSEKIASGGTQTIFEYQAQLRTQFDSNRILVRPSKNLNNAEKIGVLLDTGMYPCIKLMGIPQFEFHRYQDRLEDWWNYIFVDKEDIDLLVHLTNKIATKKPSFTLAENIGLLADREAQRKPRDKAKEEVVEKYSNLFRALINEPVDVSAPPYSVIIEHFVNDTEAFLQNPERGIEEIIQSAKSLDEKLYGTPPISKKVRTAICAVLGALIGALIGTVIGALATSWGEGFASFVEAIENASKGFVKGTIIGGVTAAAGAAAIGFFRATNADEAYQTQKRAKQAQENKAISTSIDNALRPMQSTSAES